MRLTNYTDYALRVSIQLAVRPRELTTIGEIADSYRIPENDLTKVVHRLGVAGYIEAVRGRNGGIRMFKKPGDINIGEVVRRMEPDFDPVPCFNASDSCVIEPACVLEEALGEARHVSRRLVSYTVAYFVELAALLAMPAAIGLETIAHSRMKT